MAAGKGPSHPIPTSEYAYDVFLSFRGEDTRQIFTVRLYSALMDAGFGTFIDDNGIERGEDIKTELIGAIHHSKGSIVVLSKNYANSGWCLDELVMIVEQRKSRGHVILPVFYHVTPAQVGKQMDSFAEAFDVYEEQAVKETDQEKRAELMEKIKKRRDALRQVAELDGMILRHQIDFDDENETTFIQKIVQVIEDRLNRAVLTGTHKLIGIESRVKDVDIWLKDASHDERNLLVISGVGGIGKTTIAKHAYIDNFEQFAIRGFLENVRGISDQPNGLICLQRELLSVAFGGNYSTISSVDEGMAKIRDHLFYKRFLLVLDDVDQVDQVNALLGSRDWFSTGSRIIITTRHENLLNSDKTCKFHKVKPLGSDDSQHLFSLHAFGQDHPVDSFRDLSLKVLDRCEGLPLALKLIGSSLSGKGKDVWKNVIEKLEVIPQHQILKLLRISYDTLPDDHDKNLFLHIACFFVREFKSYTAKILDECAFHAAVGIRNLINRNLLSVDNANVLTMHQLVQDMGREVVRQECPRIPGMRSRLWRNKDSFDVLRDESATETIVGLLFDMRRVLEDSSDAYGLYDGEGSSGLVLKTDAFTPMHNLMLLQLNYVRLTGNYAKFPKRLRWLRCRGFPLKSIPNDFPMEHLVALDMSNSGLVYAWRQRKVAQFMKILDLSHCRKLLKTPEFSGLPNLEKLNLEDCRSLVEVHESIGYLNGLLVLNLLDCKALRKLPQTIIMLKHLETLIISGCSNLCEFPSEMEKLVSLRDLRAGNIAKPEPLSTAVRTNSWHACFRPYLSRRNKVLSIPWVSLPKSLVHLSLSDSNLFVNSFPRDFSNLILLEELNLSRNPLDSLPEGIKGLSRLQSLTLISCKRLKSLCGLPDVKKLWINSCTSLETINHVSNSYKLQEIDYNNCENLSEVQGLFKLESSTKIGPQKLKTLGFLKSGSMPNYELNLQDGITFTNKKRSCQLLYEFGIFSTSIPEPNNPEWCRYKCAGSSISFETPSLPNFQSRSLNICFVYAMRKISSLGIWPFTYPMTSSRHLEEWTPQYQLFVKITNKTRNRTWIYFPTTFAIPDAGQDLLWMSHWTFRDQLEDGDEVDVSIIAGDSLQIKECGANFVYEELDEDTKKNYLSWKEVIGGDLSAFQLSNGAFYLCRTVFLRNDRAAKMAMVEDWTKTKWGKSLFDGSIDFSEVCYVNWMGLPNKKPS